MEKLVLIKLGGSLITDKSKERTPRPEMMAKLADEMISISGKLDGKMIVAHGAGSFAHRPADQYKVNNGIKGPLQFKGFPIVADRAVELNRIVIKTFIEMGIPAVSFSPESMIMSDDRKPESVFTDSLEHALTLGFLPVLYGDIVFDKKIGACIYSTEMVLGALADKLAQKYEISFVYCTDTDGVYDLRRRTIPEINSKNIKEVEKFITGSKSTDVTGGMIHKVYASLEMAKLGMKTIIVNGNKLNELKSAVLGKEHHGTEISD